MESPAGESSAFGVGGRGAGGLGEDLKVELLIEARQLPIGGHGKQFVGEVHENAVVADSVFGQGDLEFSRHEISIAGRMEEVVEAGQHLVAAGVLEGKAAADAAAEGEELR